MWERFGGLGEKKGQIVSQRKFLLVMVLAVAMEASRVAIAELGGRLLERGQDAFPFGKQFEIPSEA